MKMQDLAPCLHFPVPLRAKAMNLRLVSTATMKCREYLHIIENAISVLPVCYYYCIIFLVEKEKKEREIESMFK